MILVVLVYHGNRNFTKTGGKTLPSQCSPFEGTKYHLQILPLLAQFTNTEVFNSSGPSFFYRASQHWYTFLVYLSCSNLILRSRWKPKWTETRLGLPPHLHTSNSTTDWVPLILTLFGFFLMIISHFQVSLGAEDSLWPFWHTLSGSLYTVASICLIILFEIKNKTNISSCETQTKTNHYNLSYKL